LRRVLGAWDLSPTIKVIAVLVTAVVLTFLARRIVNKRAAKVLARFTSGSTDPAREAIRTQTVTSVTRSTLIGIIWLLAILAIFQILNTVLSTFVLAVTLLGSALTFGAQSLIKDVLSGFFIIVEDQYAVGDTVDLGLASGTVEQVTLRVTRLRDGEGKVWWVPNGQIARAGNFTQDWARAVVDVAVSRDSDVDKATATILEVAERTLARPELAERTLEPAKVLGVQQVDDRHIVLRVSVKVAKGAQDDIRRALQASLLGAFRDGRLTSPPVDGVEPPPAEN
jgi:moderate conductance mechanosensitive channel